MSKKYAKIYKNNTLTIIIHHIFMFFKGNGKEMFKKREIFFDGAPSIEVSGLGVYDLAATMECGQCFRYERLERDDGITSYMTVVGDELIRVCQPKLGTLIFIGMTDEAFERVAREYFSLDLDLSAIKEDIISRTDSEWLIAAASFAEGIAILKQDPFEALISFIISQNNNIPRIRKIVREISAQYGECLSVKNDYNCCPLRLIEGKPSIEACKTCGRCFTFPSAQSILEHPEELLPSKPGFRYSYILDAVDKIASGEVRLEMIAAARSYNHTVECLKVIKGVGDKVASCVALFGFRNLEAFPIDVWMKRAIDTYFDGSLDPATLGRYAGVAQQYIFHYIRVGENNK